MFRFAPLLQLVGPVAHMNEYQNYLGLVFAILIFIGLDVVFFIMIKRSLPRGFVIGGEIVLLLFWLFGLDIGVIVTSIALVSGCTLFFVANINENRTFIGNNMLNKVAKPRKRRARPESLFDREAMYHKVENAVITLSRKKTGALITFQKKDLLSSVMKTGTQINAPVSSELLQTIFYPGTRLHDGAVIIIEDQIAAASVYFTPTTRPLTGKYGSRHRAAIGISEISDAVTVIVSEETGRISIAYEGELQTVGPDTFYDTLLSYMSLEKQEDKE